MSVRTLRPHPHYYVFLLKQHFKTTDHCPDVCFDTVSVIIYTCLKMHVTRPLSTPSMRMPVLTGSSHIAGQDINDLFCYLMLFLLKHQQCVFSVFSIIVFSFFNSRLSKASIVATLTLMTYRAHFMIYYGKYITYF